MQRKEKESLTSLSLSYDNLSSVKTHLISGIHDNSDGHCPNCLKKFEGPIGLLKHMESATLRCNIRESEDYERLLFKLSGGFIKFNDNEKGMVLPDGAPRMRALTREELVEQQGKNEEAARERESERARRREDEW